MRSFFVFNEKEEFLYVKNYFRFRWQRNRGYATLR